MEQRRKETRSLVWMKIKYKFEASAAVIFSSGACTIYYQDSRQNNTYVRKQTVQKIDVKAVNNFATEPERLVWDDMHKN